MATLICESSHLCFGKARESAHKLSHLCFGKRYHPNLQPLEVAAVSSILEDAVNQLAILGKTLPVDQNTNWDEGFKDVESRFGKPPPLPREFPELAGIWPPETQARLKIQRDRLFTELVLEDALKELSEKGSFATLRTSLDWQSALRADEADMLDRLADGREKVDSVTNQMSEDKKRMRDEAKFWEKKTELLTSNLHDAHLVSGLTRNYARLWEQTRRDQQGIIFRRLDDDLHAAIDRVQDPDLPNEERVHNEMMRFLAIDIEHLKKELDHWTDKYDAEMMQRETDLIRMRNSREQQIDQHAELHAEIRRRDKTFEDVIVMRATNEKKQEAIKNIIAIQAWWRGVMFRAGITLGKNKKNKSKGKKRKRGVKSKKT